jgi:tetratricopeptide (TPR) repeat protein
LNSSAILPQRFWSAKDADGGQVLREHAMENGISAFVTTARKLVKSKDYEGAIAKLRSGLEDDPGDRTAQEMLGVLLFRLRHHAEAADVFRHLTRLTPRDAGAWVNLGAVLNVLDDFKGASDALRKAIQRDKDCGVAYYNLAIAQKAQKQSAMAVSAYDECLRLEPANAQASINLANLLLELKNFRKTSRVVTAALEHAPKSAKLKNLQLRVEAGVRGSQLAEPPFGRLVDENDLARSQKTLMRRELSRSDRNREREFMRETARELRHAVRPMVPILDRALPKHMHTLHLAAAQQDARNEASVAFEGLVSTISELASIRESVSESVMGIRSHLKKTDPGL